MDQVSYEHRQASMTDSFDVFPSARPLPLTLPNGKPAIEAWPLDQSILHLNHGSFGAVPNSTLKAVTEYESQANRAPIGWFPGVGACIRDMRSQLAEFLGVPPSRVAWVPNASAGASVVYANIRVSRGSEVLATDHGYGAVLQGAARMARRDGAVLKIAHVPIDADEDGVVDAVTAQMSERTSFIVLDQITSATAMLFPVQRIAAEAHRRGIRILVDGAHAPAQLADPVGGLQSDWWVGNFHKFPCTPRGTALLVIPPEGGQDGQDLWPLIDSWGFAGPFPERFDEQGTQNRAVRLPRPSPCARSSDCGAGMSCAGTCPILPITRRAGWPRPPARSAARIARRRCAFPPPPCVW